jgi:hypothetical protein
MLSYEEHLDSLVRHISLVREACLLLGKKLISRGRKDLGRILIANGFMHDVSKFHGIEWDYLHVGNKDVPKEKLNLAIRQHTRTNPHHPEYWGGIEKMPEVYLAEMVCDWYARSQEFGTGLREWVKDGAINRYKIDTNSHCYQQIQDYLDLMLDDPFNK